MKQWSLAAVHCCFINQYYIWRRCLNACITVVWVKQSSVIRNDQTKQTKSRPLSRRINSKHNSTRGIEHWNHPLFYNCINPSVTGRWLDWWWTIVLSKTRLVPAESSCRTITEQPFPCALCRAAKPIPAKTPPSRASMAGAGGLQPSLPPPPLIPSVPRATSYPHCCTRF